ncbi:CHAT domain-containing protein [Kitasatospora sp. NPDC056184]|uniref:CHAT domain-containing protein n=1 Tax=Kitasatospora sp. NPDC056184 TaxID=3345738 RepID=UPI0035E0C037
MREARLAALWARLERTRESGDPSWILGPDALRDARRLAESHDDDEVRYALGWFRWSRYLYGRRRGLSQDVLTAELTEAVEAFTRCFMVGAGDPPEPLLPVIAERAAPQAVAALRRAQASPDRIACGVAAMMVQRVLAATPADSRERAERLALVAEVVRDWGVRGLRILDPDLLLACVREALEAAPPDHPDRVAWLTDAAGLLQARGQRTESAGDLDEAAELAWEAAVEAGPGHPDGAEPLWLLGITLASRHNVTAVDADLDRAITYLRMALAATPSGHPRHAIRLSHLGTALRARYHAKGEPADLEQAIVVGRRAVTVGSAEEFVQGDALATLGNALWARRLLTGSAADRDEAIALAQRAADTVSDQERPVVLANLGGRLAQRFDRTAALADADAAVEQLRQAADATRARGDSVFLEAAANLGTVLLRRFEATGALADLDDAVATSREVAAAATKDPLYLWGALSNLGSMLMRRSERTGEAADLDEAVGVTRAAAAAATEPDTRRNALANLGSALQARSHLSGSVADLNEAITVARDVVATATDPADLASARSSLANALVLKAERGGTPEDLDEAIALGRQVADTGPADHHERASCLSNLGGALTGRFRRTGSRTDLTEAISHYLAAAEAAATASAAVRASYRAARLLAEAGDHGRAAQAAEKAVLRLSDVAPRRLERGDQQHAVGQFAGLAGRAAALALAAPGGTDAERAARALRLLEAGRAVLLGQTLETRGDLTELHALRPDLAARYVELRARLDTPASAAAAIRPLGRTADQEHPDERLVRGRRLAAEAFAALLGEIRGLDAFTAFGVPPTDEELIAEAAHGPVVVFNISEYRSDALLITPDGIRSLELPGLTPRTVTDQVNRFRDALYTTRADTGANGAELEAAQEAMVAVLQWLWDAATGPVLTALKLHGRQDVSDDWPRVWWVPGGLLGLLPLHASGYHDDRPDKPRRRRTVMDRVVSSYTPTVRALRHSRERAARATAGRPARSLVVAMPTTPGLPGHGRLHYVGKEVAMLLGRLPDPVLLQEPEPGGGRAVPASALPTRDHVLAQLPHCAIAHFACHGYSDAADPSRSLLLLHDYARAPLTVASLASVALDEARLAFLSACRTAAIDNSELLDEAIHLTSAFQLAGFPHVIGTLWEINDQVAVTVASLFYTGLGADHAPPDPDRAARALHQAVRRVRDGHGLPAPLNFNGAPRLWAAHLHAGA